MVADDRVRIEIQGFRGAGGDFPSGDVNRNGAAVVQFKPLASGVVGIIKAVRIGNDLVEANVAGTRCGTSGLVRG